MKRKIKDYLNSKEKSEYNNLDKIFVSYLKGNIKQLLSEYDGIGIHPTVNKLDKTIQLEYSYNNIYVIIDFFENKYDILMYHSGIDIADLDQLSIVYYYQDDFSLEKLINEIDKKIKNHPKLKDTTLIKKKKKLYSLLAWISLCLPIMIFGGLGLYCIVNESTIKGNIWWLIFFIIIPLISWFIFDVKSKRIK